MTATMAKTVTAMVVMAMVMTATKFTILALIATAMTAITASSSAIITCSGRSDTTTNRSVFR